MRPAQRARGAVAAAAAVAALVGTAAPLSAQGNTAEMLQRAIRLYENVEIEQALVILNQIISPQSPFVVTPDQQVLAYKYLGAALALQRGQLKQDSAVQYFRAALERDPFTDLDPASFSPIQLQAFQTARGRTFAVGLKPVVRDTVDPRTERIRFRALTSHESNMRLELRSGSDVRQVLYVGTNTGLREIEWDGLLADGRLAPPGRYQLVLIGESRLLVVPTPLTDSTRVFLELRHDHPPLEDTLPPLTGDQLLPEQHPSGAATRDLLKGVGVAAAALAIRNAVGGAQLAGNQIRAGAVAAAGLTVGVAAFFYRQSHRAIPANIAENGRRRAERDRNNAGVRERNAALLAETKLVISPAAGVGP
jgi:hypothetical protein